MEAYGRTPGEVLIWLKWVIETEMITWGIVFHSVCWELFVSFWDKDWVIIYLQPSLVLFCVPMSHITGMALEQNVQATDKSSVPSRFCCHCCSRSFNEGRCKAATESRKNGPKLSTDCSTSKLLSKNREHQVNAWEVQVHHQADADFCGISLCVLGTHCGKRSRRVSKLQWSLEKHTPSSLHAHISLVCQGYASLGTEPGYWNPVGTPLEFLYILRMWWEHLGFIWLPSSKVSERSVVAMATIITLTQKKASSSKAQPLEIEPFIIEVPADTADAHWKRIEVSTDTGG